MRPDELTLQEQLIASTAIANHRRTEQVIPTNGEAAAGAVTPATAVVPLGSNGAMHLQQHVKQCIAPAVESLMPAMSLEAARERWNMIHDFIGGIMRPDEDFGTIAGAKKPSLLKPGAEKLTAF